MAQTADTLPIQEHLEEFNQALGSGTFVQIRRLLDSLRASEVADLLEASPPKTRDVLWQLIKKSREGDILQELSDELRSHFLKEMETHEVVALTEGLETDNIADILQQLPDQVTREVLESMSHQDRERVESVIDYPEDTAGGLMNTDVITVRPKITLDVVMRYLRRHETLPAMTDNIFVVNRHDQLVGILPIRKLLVTDPNITVREVMKTELEGIPAEMDDSEVANLFERHDWVSAPVVGKDNKLLGRITIDDVVDVIREDADHSLMSMAGLDEDEDTFAPIFKTWPRRAVWLSVNLLTAFAAASVINLFQDSIEKVVALAVLMPIVASMGGVAGTQALTVVIRGMALGQIGHNNRQWLVNRELLIGLLNGLCWSLVIAIAASLWFGDPKLGMIIAAAIVINMTIAGLAGSALPLILKALNIDPALAGGMALTTVTDVMGFLSFLGLATWFYA
jgi:magnesium transporter